MARNVEIKARVRERSALLQRALALATAEAEQLVQDDSFFNCPNGRLKLRCLGDGSAELIFYQRADVGGPKLSAYWRCPVTEAEALRETLSRAWGLTGRVIKRRLLVMAGRARIHIDEVDGLGDFLELEVVLAEAEAIEAGQAEAQSLLAQLRVPEEDLITRAYVDLLADARASGQGAAT